MNDPLIVTLVTLALIFLSAIFVIIEFALLGARRHRLEELAATSSSARNERPDPHACGGSTRHYVLYIRIRGSHQARRRQLAWPPADRLGCAGVGSGWGLLRDRALRGDFPASGRW